jgi:methionyl-tRNA formyltransferase
LRTVYLGTSEFAAAVLRRLAATEHRPTLVLTRPDRPKGRGRRTSAPPVADAAREFEIAVSQPDSVNDPVVTQLIAAAKPDALIVCAFGALIKEPLLSAYNLLNVHPSLLPRWRGAAPIERALMAGDSVTGVSIMRLEAGLDSGPVCLSASEPITARDTYGSLSERLRQISAELLIKALRERPPFVEQPERGITYAEKITAEDRLLDPSGDAVVSERVVRALHPHIGARVVLADGTLLGVHSARLGELPGESDAAAGSDVEPPAAARAAAKLAPGVHELDGRLLLVCRAGALELLVVQPPGGRAMDAAAFLRGRGLPDA